MEISTKVLVGSGLIKTTIQQITKELKVLGFKLQVVDEAHVIKRDLTNFHIIPDGYIEHKIIQITQLVQLSPHEWTAQSVANLGGKIPKSLIYSSKRRAKRRFNLMYLVAHTKAETNFIYGISDGVHVKLTVANWGRPSYTQAESRRHRSTTTGRISGSMPNYSNTPKS